MYHLYNAILSILKFALSISIPFLYLFNKKSYHSIRERLGSYRFSKPLQKPIWIQAASVGEVMIAEKLIRTLKSTCPQFAIVLTTTTSTGKAIAKEKLDSLMTVVHFPFDFKSSVKRALAAIDPLMFIMIETEIWPNFLAETQKSSIPCMIVNGRISDKSYGRYRLVKSLIGKALKGVEMACMSSQLHASRIRSLGMDDQKIKVTGNIKFDLAARFSEGAFSSLKHAMAIDESNTVFIAGSTAEGEDEPLIKAYLKTCELCQKPVLIIAPRHIDRTSNIEEILRSKNLGFSRLSALKKEGSRRETDIIIVDTIGDLPKIYSFGKIIFVGGSLVPVGGHNIIEPALYGKPVIFGNHMQNFQEIARAFTDSGAGFMVDDTKELIQIMELLLKDEEVYRTAGRRARIIVEENAGALNATVAEIGRCLSCQ